MPTRQQRATPGYNRRRGNNCARENRSRTATHLAWIAASALLAALVLAPAWGDPDDCSLAAYEASCSGDQSDGIASGDDFPSPPVTILNVHALSTGIAPSAPGVPGIFFYNGLGQDVTVNSGTAEDPISIAALAPGIIAISHGVALYPAKDPFLDIPIPGSPETGGGVVTANNYADIATIGQDAHGIFGYSYTTGYPPSVVADLLAFKAEYELNGAGVGFEMDTVFDADGTAVDTGTQVDGSLLYLIPDPGCDLASDPDCRIDPDANQELSGTGGVFVIKPDGTFTFHPRNDFQDLAVGDTITTAVSYTMTGTHDSATRTDITAQLIARVTMTEQGLEISYQAIFDDYGESMRPNTDGTVMPDLGVYVDDLIRQAAPGGSGSSVNINHFAGTIVTDGPQAFGVYGLSHGINGGHGNNGGGFWSFGFDPPSKGGNGWAGGDVNVTADGDISTLQDLSLGIFAYSHGGNGGTGGDGGTYYGGRAGGTGGSAGDVDVSGDGTIETDGDFSTGILALSEGGHGGLGGDGGWFAGGALGGYGGIGGTVVVDGGWTITTQGDKAHGVWAKSLGGSAGQGGSGGWLVGKAADGGQGAQGGTVIIRFDGSVETFGSDAFGLYAQSVGGFGGSGGTGGSIFAGFGGDGQSAGSGGDVSILNLADGIAITHGTGSHAIFAQSVGGGGGSGGGAGGLIYGAGGSGASGGQGGTVLVENAGTLETFGVNARGIIGQSIGGGGGDGGIGAGIVGIGGSASGTSAGGLVDLRNAGEIFTHNLLADAIYAQSIGGGGGSGGAGGGFVSIGGDGGGGGDGGTVSVQNSGLIGTEGLLSRGIVGQSVGGGGGDGGFAVGLIVGLGGDGAVGGDGGNVSIDNSGSIWTDGIVAQGIFAQSVGGGGGSGGGSGAWIASLGGRGDAGGIGGNVIVTNSGLIATDGFAAQAIFAQSVGGGGGSGGGSGGMFVAIGGDAGDGSLGGAVTVDNTGMLLTNEAYSAGVFAQSIGGGGGNGAGSGAWFASLGGDGGTGGHGGTVDVSNDGLVATLGAWSHSIFAQSVGGGGGSGGGSGGVWVAIGGDAEAGGDGGAVGVSNSGELETEGFGAKGVFAQSVGGGGGSGGGSGALNIAIGGDGGDGGLGGNVTVSNDGQVLTGGDLAQAIFAQSIGGSGGDGGNTGSMFVTVGGDGGAGNDGGDVTVTNNGLINTLGNVAAGVFAQSVGGSGGSGGNATSVQVAGPFSLTVAVGGDGGDGGDGGNVNVSNNGSILTQGVISDAVYAQSVGGSGGSGGSATTISVVFPVEIEGVEIPAMSMNVAVGGRGADGGAAGTVDVINAGNIMTTDFLSNGVFAQSVGGGGGKGGNATNVQIAYDATFTGSVAVGGAGGDGGTGNTVTVGNSGGIHTQGAFSNGVFAQSVGGGGGSGGDATSLTLALTPPPTAPSDFIPMPSMSFNLAIGGDGGNGGLGGDIGITNTGSIMTEGHFAAGVMAQSVGGSGGSGGDATVINVELSADPMDFITLLDLLSFDTTLVFGGDGGNGATGGDVIVSNQSDIVTSGAFSHGVLAQSIGGNGGFGGSAMTFEFSTTDLPVEIPVLDDIAGLTTIEMTLQGDGGNGGDGGNILLDSNGNVWTSGDFAMGVVGQSVAGSGGLAGFYNPHGISNNEILNTLFNTFVDTDAGLSFAGSLGGIGTAGGVEVDHTGDIYTFGDGAHGLFAQSVAGQGQAGNVSIGLDGDIFAVGHNAHGIFAHSFGGSGSGTIDIQLNGGVVMGGSGGGAGVFIAGGLANSLSNSGLITAAPGVQGHAIITTEGDDTVLNAGTVTGSVYLGSGANHFDNSGLVNAGTYVDVGQGNWLYSSGHIAPGGMGNVYTTHVFGNVEQTETGTLWYDLDFDYGDDTSDWLDITGTARLDGLLAVALHNPGRVMPGQHALALISSSSGIDEFGLELSAPASAVLGFSLLADDSETYALHYKVDFAPMDLNDNQAAIGEHVNEIQLAGGTLMMEPLTASLVAIPDQATLAAAYDRLSPHIYAANQLNRLYSSLGFEQAMHSCPVRDADLRFSAEGECFWMRVSDRDVVYEANDGSIGGRDTAQTIGMGLQRALSPHWHGGLALGFETAEYEIPQASYRDGEQVQLGAIAKGRYGRNQVNLSFVAGTGDFRTERTIGLPTPDARSLANRDVDFVAFHTGYMYNLERGNWFLRPGIDIGWTRVDGEAFDEQDAGPGGLSVRQTRDDFLTSRADLLFGGEIVGRNDILYRPYIRASYTHLHDGTANEIYARLAGAPDDVPYFRQVLRPDDNLRSLGLGIDVLTNSQTAIRLGYDKQFGDTWDMDAFLAKIIVDF